MADDLDAMLQGCRRHDRAAQRQLYERFHRTVYRLAARLVGAQEAADLSQEVFLRLYTTLDQFGGRAAFTTWLYRLTVNTCLAYLRQQARRPRPLLADPPGNGVGPAHRLEQTDLLEQALARLDGPLRAVFLLREVEQLRYHEIAAVLGIPPGTVASQLSRARTELQQFLRRVEQGQRDAL